MSRLERYREKRDRERSPEPFESTLPSGGRIFVVQRHHATSLHWDLRLELGGALVSWAIPKGPSPDPSDRRLAMKVEDHPLDYADFEGVIPEGEYGAGPVIVWDRGRWTPVEDPEEGLEAGKLSFELRGHRLRGRWTLVRTDEQEEAWLLLKERDAFADERGQRIWSTDSIFSGLEVDELPRASERAAAIASALAEAGAEEADVDPREVSPMLAVSREEPFSRPGWVFEFKLDGYRLLAGRREGETVLISRNGNDLTATFPEIARAVVGLPYEGLLMDGEVLVQDERGLPSFDRLQRRGRLVRAADVRRAALELPATYWAFDLLACEGLDARALPLAERKRILREIAPSAGPIRYSEHVEENGEAAWERAMAIDLEGVVGKRADSPYREGRSNDWVKVRAVKADDFVVVGWTEPKGSRIGFGSLQLAQYADGELVWTGGVGTGFSDAQLADIADALEPLQRDEPPCRAPEGSELPRDARHRWVDPALVVEVRYREVTDAGMLRHPVFVRRREEKPVEACVRDDVHPRLEEPPAAERPEPEREVRITSPDKVLWPDAGHTKSDLLDYYRAVAERMLPFLRDRPVALARYPDGIEGDAFFQKNAPGGAPDWLRTASVWSEGSGREIDYLLLDDVESLLWVANSAALVIHAWSSRATTLEAPDWCVLDLDPGEAGFARVVEVARAVRELCREIGLPAFAKTSGATGLHVLISLGRQVGHEEARTLGELLARVVAQERSATATVERSPEKREGRVYVDYLQNGRGKLLVAPYSTRPLPGAPVSTPLRWREVDGDLDPSRFTIESVPRRIRSQRSEPMAPVLELEPDLAGALDRLDERLRA